MNGDVSSLRVLQVGVMDEELDEDDEDENDDALEFIDVGELFMFGGKFEGMLSRVFGDKFIDFDFNSLLSLS